jgi:hypothetical protein
MVLPVVAWVTVEPVVTWLVVVPVVEPGMVWAAVVPAVVWAAIVELVVGVVWVTSVLWLMGEIWVFDVIWLEAVVRDALSDAYPAMIVPELSRKLDDEFNMVAFKRFKMAAGVAAWPCARSDDVKRSRSRPIVVVKEKNDL